MTDKEIMIRIQAILVDDFEIDPEVIRPEATLYDELGLDSLDSVDLVLALEKEFGFKIERTTDEKILRAMRNLSDVCDFVKDKLQQQSLYRPSDN